MNKYQKRCGSIIVVFEFGVDVSVAGDDGPEFIGYKIWDPDGWMGVPRRLRDVVHYFGNEVEVG